MEVGDLCHHHKETDLSDSTRQELSLFSCRKTIQKFMRERLELLEMELLELDAGSIPGRTRGAGASFELERTRTRTLTRGEGGRFKLELDPTGSGRQSPLVV